MPDVVVEALADDSRNVRPSSCFVAIRGAKVDGHAFVRQAIAAGATVVIVDDPEVPESEGRAHVVRVADTPEAMARLAAAYYGVHRGGPSELRLVGVTGTNGKSTVAWLVREIIKAVGQKCALVGTIEYDLGGKKSRSQLTTPGALGLCQMLAEAHATGARYAALEVSSHALEQRRCDGLTFDAAIFTNLSGDHLDYHDSMEAYFAAKARLFDLCDNRSTAIVNADDEHGRRLLNMLNCGSVSFGIDAPDAIARAHIACISRLGSDVTLHLPGGPIKVPLPLVGRHNVSNALAAALACESLGVDHETIRRGLESCSVVPGRLQRVDPEGCPFSVLVDYAHTDAALENVLTAVRPITANRLICVFGCGGDRDRTKRPRMAKVVERLADVAFVTSDNPRSEEPQAIIDEIMPGFRGLGSCKVHVDADRRTAINMSIESARPGDTVLIAGKGHEDYQIIGTRRIHFDDAEVAAACIRRALDLEVPA